MSDVALAYETLDRQSQIEVEQLVFRLVEKQKQAKTKKKRTREEIESMLDSFIGCSTAWQDVDILAYQRQLRGEYRDHV